MHGPSEIPAATPRRSKPKLRGQAVASRTQRSAVVRGGVYERLGAPARSDVLSLVCAQVIPEAWKAGGRWGCSGGCLPVKLRLSELPGPCRAEGMC